MLMSTAVGPESSPAFCMWVVDQSAKTVRLLQLRTGVRSAWILTLGLTRCSWHDDRYESCADFVEAVFSSHNIEHLYPHEVPIALAEFHRVLKPDGFVLLTCPDLQSVCARVANDQLTDAAYQSGMGPITPLDILYGHRASMKAGNLYMAHRCGFTKKVLASSLSVAGFDAGVKARPTNYDLWAVGLKPLTGNSERLKQLCKIYLP